MQGVFDSRRIEQFARGRLSRSSSAGIPVRHRPDVKCWTGREGRLRCQIGMERNHPGNVNQIHPRNSARFKVYLIQFIIWRFRFIFKCGFNRYKKSAKRISGMFRDQIQPPLERAVFWTEFVLRHKGTDHLRLGSIDMAPYQRALVDVYFVFSLFFIIPLLLVFFCVRKCCCAKRPAAAPPVVRNEQIKKRQ